MVLAGGVSVRSRQAEGYLYQEGMILSPDGHCRAFDAKAQGTVGGNGAGMVVLKRLDDALADNDHIYAVIKSSAVNNDGRVKVGYTAPSVEGQAAVISAAMQGLEYDSIGYIETHGTGTMLGDPIEIAALTQAYRKHTEKTGFCLLGSVKTNIGHLDTAAGVAGLIKTVLAIKHRILPPSLHFEQANPAIDFEHSPFFVNDKLTSWISKHQPRRAGVSSFGIGGTNAHVVLEEAPPTSDKASSSIVLPAQLLVLSAKTPTALDAKSRQLADFLQSDPEVNLADVAYTLAQGRKAFPYRRSLVCKNIADALPLLVATKDVIEQGRHSVVLMFSGQGAQYVNMGLELYRYKPYFCEQIALCLEALKPHVDFDLAAILYPKAEQADAAGQQLRQTEITQPALFTIEYALAQLWRRWGVTPTAMLGHSIGEYVAACLSGVFSLSDALMLVATRGRLMQSLPGGSMLSVALPEQQIGVWLTPELSLAAVNAPNLCVVAGVTAAIDTLETQLTDQNIACVRLHTSHAFHSSMMTPILEEFTDCVKKITLNPPSIPYLSNLSGGWITADQATDPGYWAAHIVQPVRFSQCVQTLLNQPDVVFLETGPGQTLAGLVKQQNGLHQPVFTSLPHPKDSRGAYEMMLTTLGKVWAAGVTVDWNSFYGYQQRRRLPLPTYPLERQRYWIDAPLHMSSKPAASAEKRALEDWFYVPSWQRSVLDVTAASKLTGQYWLVFADDAGLSDYLAQHLSKQGGRVVKIKTYKTFKQTDDGGFLINPSSKQDFIDLFKALEELPDGIVYAWPVTVKEQLPSTKELETLCFSALLYLTQALGDSWGEAEIRLTVLSNNMQPMAGETALQMEKALLLGPVKVIAKEYPYIITQSIDVSWPQATAALAGKLAAQLCLELAQAVSAVRHQPIIAWRDHQRWLQTFEPVPLKAPTGAVNQLKKQGVYLITGGLGGIGLVLAEYLATNLQAKLILTGRSRLPPRDQWADWLSGCDSNDPIGQKINKLLQFEASGSELIVDSVDVADREQMQALVEHVQSAFGAINGVIHAAGVACGGMMQHKEPAAMQAIMNAKVTGSCVLADLFADAELDFLVFCSSLSVIRGDFGQVDYCAANAFMDVLSHQLQRQGRRCLSINWDIWQEVGMGANAQLPKQLWALHNENLKRGIMPEEGVDAFERILIYGQAQTIVSARDINYWFAVTDADLQQQMPKLNRVPGVNLTRDYVAPGNEFEIKLAEIWQELLGIETIDIHDDFFELGGHSLLATQVIARIRQIFGTDLTLPVFFDNPTIGKMSEFLLIKQFDQLEIDELERILAETGEFK